MDIRKAIFYLVTVILVNAFAQSLAMDQLLALTGHPKIFTDIGYGEGKDLFFLPFTYTYILIRYGQFIPDIVKETNTYFYAGLIGSLLFCLLIKKLSTKTHLTSAGSAKWADFDDMKKKKVIQPYKKVNDGVICGTWYSGISHETLYKLAGQLVCFMPRLFHILQYHNFQFNSEKYLRKVPPERLESIMSWLYLLTGSSRYYIVDPVTNPTHMILIAPSRAGKGIGIIIPTLLTWRGSMIVSDLKEENLQMSGAYRKYILGHEVIAFAPTDDRPTYRFNPVNEIRWGTPNEGKDVENLLDIIVGPPDGKDAHWKTNAKALLTGSLIHLKYKHARMNMDKGLTPYDEGYIETSLYHVREFLTVADLDDNNEPMEFRDKLIKENQEVSHFPNELWVHNVTSDVPMLLLDITQDRAQTITIFTEEAKAKPDKHPTVQQQFGAFISKPDGEGGSVLSTAITALDIFGEKIVADNTATSDFILGDIRGRKKPTDLFLVVPPSDMSRVGKLFKLIMEFIITRGTENEAKAKKQHKCLLLIDEFPAFGKMDNLVRELGYIASYGFKALIVVQGLEQIKEIYKNYEILTNAVTQIFLSPRDGETKKHLSETLGKATIMIKQKSGKISMLPWAQDSVSYIEKDRALLLPEETITKLANESAIIIESITIKAPKNKWFLCPDMLMKRADADKRNTDGPIGYRPIYKR